MKLQSAVFGAVELEIEPLCECPCSTITVRLQVVCIHVKSNWFIIIILAQKIIIVINLCQ